MIHIIEIFPVVISGKTCLCIGFEPANENMGDHFHLAFIFSGQFRFDSNLTLSQILQQVQTDNIPVRIHSECILGDVFKSLDCDCNYQLKKSLQAFTDANSGILIYLRQEGRGIGLRKKMKCLALQMGYYNGEKIYQKYSADEANLFIKEEIDKRSYKIAAEVLKYLGIQKIKLMTGNPQKIMDIAEEGIEINELNLEIDFNDFLPSQKARSELFEKMQRGYKYTIVNPGLNG